MLEAPDWLHNYVTDFRRADGLCLLPSSSGVILDLGCGFGTLSFAAARRWRLVIAADLHMGKLRVMGLRAAAEGYDNILPIKADVFNLPIREDSLDAVIVNGLLEWLGLTYLVLDPRLTQRMALIREQIWSEIPVR
jgi:ubiquinone/menaquinone biosynthesis C-methylase UbiE